MHCPPMPPTKKKSSARTPRKVSSKRENLTAQIVFRATPTLRERLEAYAEKHALRGLGDAVRVVLESTRW